jgi:hypothetical protein
LGEQSKKIRGIDEMTNFKDDFLGTWVLCMLFFGGLTALLLTVKSYPAETQVFGLITFGVAIPIFIASIVSTSNYISDWRLDRSKK